MSDLAHIAAFARTGFRREHDFSDFRRGLINLASQLRPSIAERPYALLERLQFFAYAMAFVAGSSLPLLSASLPASQMR